MAGLLQAQSLTTLYEFHDGDGKSPSGPPLVGTDGYVYGTTAAGGKYGGGTVYQIAPGGTLITLHNFCAAAGCADGSAPSGALVQGVDGSFYGVTKFGGSGSGTIYKLTPHGAFTVLYSFAGQDGAWPNGSLVRDSNGFLYGTTIGGGVSGNGTIFKITTRGTLTTLHSFCDGGSPCTDGAAPGSGLVRDPRYGDFFGTTGGGGTAKEPRGTVFKITAQGELTTLHSFCAEPQCADGSVPMAALLWGTDGTYYGTTSYGGTDGLGTAFQVTREGAFTMFDSFTGADGANPQAGLVQNLDGIGAFFGTTLYGGIHGDSFGTIFRMTSTGALTTIYNFYGPDGARPTSGLVQAGTGLFYGTTSAGGASNSGTIFSLSVVN